MDKPKTSAARNTMSEWERQCYDWGWEDAEEAILNILTPYATHDEDMCYFEGKQICYPEDCSAPLFQIVIEEIKGEQK